MTDLVQLTEGDATQPTGLTESEVEWPTPPRISTQYSRYILQVGSRLALARTALSTS